MLSKNSSRHKATSQIHLPIRPTNETFLLKVAVTGVTLQTLDAIQDE
jgi:hypothetical protein